MCGTCQVWVKESAPGSANSLNLREKIAGMRGLRRLACQVKVLGDVEITTFAGGDGRLRAPRPIAPPPNPSTDPTAKRKPIDASGTAEFVYGHPSAVGAGTRVPTQRVAAEGDEEAPDEESAAGGG
jgi:hypothetical protein